MSDDIGGPVLCLDFDGVLCDSLEECVMAAYNAYYDKAVSAFSQVPSSISAYLSRLRYLVRSAEDFFPLLVAFERGIASLDRISFARLKLQGRNQAIAFSQSFLLHRQKLKTNFESWLELHHLYAQCGAVFWPGFPRFYIVTTKDRDSVESLAKHHGYSHQVIDIYGREISTDKKILFGKLFADAAIDPHLQKIIFVDDSKENLEDVRNLPVDILLASWGYCDVMDHKTMPALDRLDAVMSKFLTG